MLGKMVIRGGDVAGVRYVSPFRQEDIRGSFVKFFERGLFADAGIDFDAWECMETRSARGVIRGLHYQAVNPQAKLVRVSAGKIWDAAVDMRPGAGYLRWQGEYLSEGNGLACYIPPGFAHGYVVVSETAVVQYICAGKFHRESDTGIIWNDPTLKINWPLPEGNPILSEKDGRLPRLGEHMPLAQL